MAQGGDLSRTLEAALALAQDAGWLRHAATHSGLLSARLLTQLLQPAKGFP